MPGVDLLRVFAAMSVVWFHMAYWSWAPGSSSTKDMSGGLLSFPELSHVAWWGWVGVPIFFVISGFVISFSASGATPSGFAKSRFLRLVPGAFVCATITALVVLPVEGATTSVAIKYLKTILFLPIGPWIDGVYWTLGIEIAFYGLVGVLLAIGQLKRLDLVMALIGCVSAGLWIWHFLRGHHTPLPLTFLPGRVFQLMLVFHGMYFAAGCMLFTIAKHGLIIIRALLLAVYVLGGLAQVYVEASFHQSPSGEHYLTVVPALVWSASLIALGLSIWWKPPFALSEGTTRLITIAGLSTYPLYLLHDKIGAGFLRVGAEVGLNKFVALGLAMGVAPAVAVAATLWLETPFREAVKGWIDTASRNLRQAREPA